MASSSLRVAVVQLQSGDDVTRNLERVRHWVARASEGGAQLVLLPENFAYFGSEAEKARHVEDLTRGGPITDALRELAISHGLHLIAGGLPEASAEPTRPYNTSAVFDPRGELLARYRKIHLFDVELPDGRALRESKGTTPGQGAVVVEIEGFRVGLSICYDLRFSNLFAEFARQGVDLITVPAAFTEQTGKDHWHVLLRARAIEWQSWVLAAAQWGSHPRDRRSYGHSMVVDPWGVVVAECSNREGVVLAEVDRELLDTVRAQLPCAAHRRPIGPG